MRKPFVLPSLATGRPSGSSAARKSPRPSGFKRYPDISFGALPAGTSGTALTRDSSIGRFRCQHSITSCQRGPKTSAPDERRGTPRGLPRVYHAPTRLDAHVEKRPRWRKGHEVTYWRGQWGKRELVLSTSATRSCLLPFVEFDRPRDPIFDLRPSCQRPRYLPHVLG